MIRRLRIAVLLFVLAGVLITTWQAKWQTTSWEETLWVALYPVAADQTGTVHRYLDQLSSEDFRGIDAFLSAQAARHGLQLQTPLNIQLRQQTAMPPLPSDRGMLATMWWSLKLRWWAWRVEANDGQAPAHIQIFLVLHDPAVRQNVPHSLGLERGLIGIVHGYASDKHQGRNAVVVTHELLHTLGATDKYDPSSTHPLHPQGFAAPDQRPLFPQTRAEIMGGRIPISSDESRMPLGLSECMIGPLTAKEINWLP